MVSIDREGVDRQQVGPEPCSFLQGVPLPHDNVPERAGIEVLVVRQQGRDSGGPGVQHCGLLPRVPVPDEDPAVLVPAVHSTAVRCDGRDRPAVPPERGDDVPRVPVPDEDPAVLVPGVQRLAVHCKGRQQSDASKRRCLVPRAAAPHSNCVVVGLCVQVSVVHGERVDWAWACPECGHFGPRPARPYVDCAVLAGKGKRAAVTSKACEWRPVEEGHSYSVALLLPEEDAAITGRR